MILTITMNPSIDVSYSLNTLMIDSINRVDQVSKTAGGKGLNVTRVLHQLKAPVLATGVLGGNFGDFIKEELRNEGIRYDFSEINGETRSCIAILHAGNQTEILEAGPEITEIEQNNFIEKYKKLLRDVDYITISGSLIRGVDVNFYSRLIAKANEFDVKVLLDTSGAALKESIESKSKPYLIKPNEHELSELIDEKIDSESSIIEALDNSLFDGIRWVVVTLGKKGALIKYDNEYYRVTIPVIEAKNPVGSGDSTIAGFAYSLSSNKEPEEIMKTGMVVGMLNAQEEKTGYINMNNFTELFEKVVVEKINNG